MQPPRTYATDPSAWLPFSQLLAFIACVCVCVCSMTD